MGCTLPDRDVLEPHCLASTGFSTLGPHPLLA